MPADNKTLLAQGGLPPPSSAKPPTPGIASTMVAAPSAAPSPPVSATVVPPRELTQRGAAKVSESKTMVAPQATRTVLRTEVATNKTVARMPNEDAITVRGGGFDATIVNTNGPPPVDIDPSLYGHNLEARLAQNRGEPMRINRYAVLRKLGEGGMGIVFSAYDEELDRRVAIKLLLTADQPGTDGRARMMREAQAMAKLSHPNVVQVYDVGVFENQIFLAMEFVKGKDLEAWSEHSHHPWQSTLEMHLQAARGLAAAHAVGLVLRDYKPENVLVGDDGRARVLDFGLARATRELDNPSPSSSIVGAVSLTRTSELEVELTVAGTVMGTPAYMSPEQHIGGPTDARSDQFSFCVALYRTLYQQPPFAGTTLTELSMNVCEGELRPAPKDSEVPSWVFDILKKGMATDPDERYPSMDTLIAALSRDLDDGVALTGRISWRWPLIAGASLLVAVFSVITLLTQPDPTPEEKTVVEELVRQAREAGSRAHWVYPDADALDDTSLLKVYALENLEGAADAFGDEEALVLRKDFASTLRGLGDRYWEDERTRSISRAYYTQALMFDDGDEELRRRTGALLTQIAADRERALRGEFSPEELQNLGLLAVMAMPEEKRDEALDAWEEEVGPDLRFEDLLLAADTRPRKGRRVKRGDGLNADPSDAKESSQAYPGTGANDGASEAAMPLDPEADKDSAPETIKEPGHKAKTSVKIERRPRPKKVAKTTDDDEPEQVVDIELSNQLADQGEAALARGAFGEAGRLFNQSLSYNNGNARSLMGLSDIAFERGKHRQSVAYAKKAVRAAPQNSNYRIKLGDAYFKTLRYEDARKAYEKAKSLGSTKADGRLRKVEERLGQ